MKKKVPQKQYSQKGSILIVIGLLLLSSTPFVAPAVASYLNSDCPKDQFGVCPFEISLPNAIIGGRLAIACGVVGLIVLGLGLYLHYRRVK